MLSKRQYEHSTGRRQKHDVIAYQIRQSSKPGEVTAAEANQIGYELAMRFTKGKHAFIVATHTDRPHIHNHIIFNSTTLDGSRKFKNFFLSYLAIQKISDRLCVQHGLSIIEPKPYREREKRTDYPKNPSFRDGICEAIDAILQQKPEDFEAFLRMLEENGYEVKRGKHIALKGKGQQRFIRLRSLGDGYSEEEIRDVIAGASEHPPKRRRKEKQFSAAPPKAAFNQLDSAGGQGKEKAKIPTIRLLNQEYAQVLSSKKAAYAEYREARKQMQELLIARKNVEAILGMDQEQEEQRRQQEQQHNTDR